MKYITKFLYAVLIIALCTTVKSFAQSFCHTPTGDADFLQSISQGQIQPAASNYCIRIFIHIMRYDAGIGGLTLSEVHQGIDRMRTDFLPHGISFYIVGIEEMNETDNTFFDGYTGDCDGDGKFDDIFPNPNYHNNAIDIYLFKEDGNTVWGGGAPTAPATSLYFSVQTVGIYSLTTGFILSHEMGHCLGLWHTFRGSDCETVTSFCPGGVTPCAEFADGSNGSGPNACGDLVQDTPADGSIVAICTNEITCTWTWTLPHCLCSGSLSNQDPQGDPYAPNPLLIMGYPREECSQSVYHTAGQGQRMRDNIANYPPLQDVVDNSGSRDLWMQDTPNDFGLEPNLFSNPLYVSEDIWVRHSQDGIESHQNPDGPATNYVYVRIRNKGCEASLGDGSERLRVYWSQASTGLSWPTTWENYAVGCTTAVFGNEITSGGLTIPSIDPGGE